MPDYSDLYNASVPVLPVGQPYNPQNFFPSGYNPTPGRGPAGQYTPGRPGSNSSGFMGTGVPGAVFGPGAQQASDLFSGNFNMYDAIDPTGILSSIFGGKKGSSPTWNPQINNGMVYQTNPNSGSTGWQNPVSTNPIPGAGQLFTQTAVDQANQINAMQQLLPYYLDAINKGNLQSAMGNLNVAQATSPGYAQLMTQIFNQYGPQLNAIGNAINRQNALAQANTENQVMAGPGQDLVKQAYGLSQVFDKPYYDTRATTAGRLGDLMNSIDLNAGLSPTERNEIAQGLAREGYQRGTANAPSATETVGNAMQYGQAGYQRKVQQQSLLGSAINTAASFLPTAKSGVDVFQVATGRPSMPNQGAAQMGQASQGVTNQGSNVASGISSGLLSGMNTLGQQNLEQSIAANQINAQKKDWADYLSQVMGSVGNLAGGVAGAALCWVAREVYGAENPKWLMFRTWLITKAPKWFFKLYVKFGPKIATFIHNKPLLKRFIRAWMDKRICQLNEQNMKSLKNSLSFRYSLMVTYPSVDLDI